MTDTRGPRPGRVPPHVKERIEAKRARAEVRARKGPWWRRDRAIAGFVLAALLLGFVVGRATTGDPGEAAADFVQREVAPLGNQADAVWTVGIGGNPSVVAAIQQLATTGEADLVAEHFDAWTDAARAAVSAIEAVEVPVAARAAHALYLASARLTLDAVEVLGAAVAHEGAGRFELLSEALRVRARAEAALAEARAAVAVLGGAEPGPVPQAPLVPELTRPDGDPPEDPFAVDPGAEGEGEEAEAEGEGAEGEGAEEAPAGQ